MWSIGCMLFTLLVGAPPFDAANPARILNRVRLEDPVIPDVGLSAEARDLIRRMLRKNPNERIKIHGRGIASLRMEKWILSLVRFCPLLLLPC